MQLHMHRLGVGTMHDMHDVMRGLFLASLQTREYTLTEKIKLSRAKLTAGVSTLWSEQVGTNLREKIPAVDVPVYLLHGIYDRTVSYTLARGYFDRLSAPVKGFYTFGRSGHSSVFAEPDRTVRILRERRTPGSRTRCCSGDRIHS
jgi:pimeloyl-ACP methyl ester carboxylesterase